jgi:hypothetical protein
MLLSYGAVPVEIAPQYRHREDHTMRRRRDQTVDIVRLYKPGDAAPVKAKALLKAFLAPNLGAVERGYDPKTGRTVFRFKALIQLIYWQLADWIDGGRLRQCAECQTYFFAEDGRQRFCPPPLGVDESRCARRARMRALRHPDKK